VKKQTSAFIYMGSEINYGRKVNGKANKKIQNTSKLSGYERNREISNYAKQFKLNQF
jgi:hypothetical protein